jgi:chromosome partitioning protein
MKVISLVNMKGGVAKTTLAVNIADCLVKRHDKKVLIIDIDPQFNATQALISGAVYKERLENGAHTVVQIFDDAPRVVAGSTSGATVQPAVQISAITPWEVSAGLFLLPGHLELYRLEMGSGQGRELRLKRYIDHLKQVGYYDFIIVDTPPPHRPGCQVLLSLPIIIWSQ